MTSQSQGIHQLLQAEKRAKDKLEEAKKSDGLPEQHLGRNGGADAAEDQGPEGKLREVCGACAHAGSGHGVRRETRNPRQLQSRRLKVSPRNRTTQGVRTLLPPSGPCA
ncbi:V-type proton ATPase subunit G 3 isoform X2 [Artibeus jamaicensis]|uniref:V-type proton ATPase subunit G 3 isoform X2 n=1 Tax=Artibeus jamaicensis TaxID=9417 RepID=UPI00235B1363|nr:V-type proton ATPase subunit G 3 isoform X2 [Artibeus jamaicensis]